MSITLAPSTWAAIFAQPDVPSRAQAFAGQFAAGTQIDFVDDDDETIRSVTAGTWTVVEDPTGDRIVAPGPYVDAALGAGLPTLAVFRSGSTEVFRASCGLTEDHEYRLLAEIEAGVPIERGSFAIRLLADAPAPTDEAPANVTPALISGVGAIDSALTSTAGVWSGRPAPIVTLQWERNSGSGWMPIAGATSPSYTPTIADLNCSISLVETAANSVGSASARSNTIGPITEASAALRSSGVPAPITLAPGQTYDLAQHISGGTGPYTFVLELGALPTGVTQGSSNGNTGNLLIVAQDAPSGQSFASPTALSRDTRAISNDIWIKVADSS
jgi:hypothetical protein